MNLKGIGYGLAAASIWGGLYVVSKVVLDAIPPFTLLAIRLILASAALGVAVWRQGRQTAWQPLTLRQKQQIAGLGLMGYGISLGMQFVGTRLSTAANGAVITSSTPAFTFLFAWWILGEKISLKRGLALAIATIGVLLVVDVRTAQLAPELFWGNMALLGAGLTWAWYSVLVRKATRQVDTLRVSLGAFASGLVIALPLAVWEGQVETIAPITPGIALGVVYIAFVATAVGAYFWNKAFELLEAGVASLTFFAQPVVGTALSVIFLGESLNGVLLAGGILIGIGLWIGAQDV